MNPDRDRKLRRTWTETGKWHRLMLHSVTIRLWSLDMGIAFYEPSVKVGDQKNADMRFLFRDVYIYLYSPWRDNNTKVIWQLTRAWTKGMHSAGGLSAQPLTTKPEMMHYLPTRTNVALPHCTWKTTLLKQSERLLMDADPSHASFLKLCYANVSQVRHMEEHLSSAAVSLLFTMTLSAATPMNITMTKL